MSGEDRPDGPRQDESTSSTPGPHEGLQQEPPKGGELDQPAPRFDDEFVLEIDEEFLSSTMDDEDLEFVLEDPGQLLGSLSDSGGPPMPVSPLEETMASAGEDLTQEPVGAEGFDAAELDGAEVPSEDDALYADSIYGESVDTIGDDAADGPVEDSDPYTTEEVAGFQTADDLEAAAPGPAEAADLDASWFNENADELAAVPGSDDAPIAEEWAEDDLGFAETTWEDESDPSSLGEATTDDEFAALLGAGEGWDGDEVEDEARPTRSLTRLLVAAALLMGVGFFALKYLAPSMLPFGNQPSTEVASVPVSQPAPVPPEPAPVAAEPIPEPTPEPVASEPVPEPLPEPVPVEPPVVAAEPVVPEAGPEVVTLAPTDLITPEPPPVRVPSAEEILRVRTTSNELVELRPGETIVELKNGHYFKGRMKRIKNDRLTLANGMSEYTFNLDEIRILEQNSPEYIKFSDLPTAAVTLQNGQRLRGRLVKQTEEHVVLAYESGRVNVPQGEVAKVSFSGRVHF